VYTHKSTQGRLGIGRQEDNIVKKLLTSRLWSLPGALLLAALLCTPAQANPSRAAKNAEADRPPNILFIIIDDIGVDQMRAFGYDLDNQAYTPAIDTVALAGVRFRNAWAMPECSPSRVSFFTGRYPLRTGVVNITLDNTLANSQMSPFEATTPNVLRARGYKSGFFGKWHHTAFASNDPEGNPNPGNPLGNAAPRDMGWDYFEGMLEGAPRAIDTTAGGVAAPGTYSCGFVNDASFGACYFTDGSCTDLGNAEANPSAGPGRSCLEQGGVLVPEQACQDEIPHQVNFNTFNGYYVAPLLINHEDGRIELVAGFDDHGQVEPPTDPRARRYLTTQQTEAAIKWIKQQPSDTPWMATLSYSTAHLPAQQPPRGLVPHAIDRGGNGCDNFLEQRVLIDKMLEAMDKEIGRLLVEIGLATRTANGQLEYQPEATDTMVVIVGDNGSYLQTVRLPFDPTRAKGTVYQTGVWVPLIVAGPLVDEANIGREIPHMVNAAVDVFALFGEVAGLDVRRAVPRAHALDAQPLLPYLTNPRQKGLRQSNFTQTGTVLQAPGVIPPCVLSVGPTTNVCTQIFTFQELCETEGGTWYGELESCCQVQQQDPSVVLLPHAAWAIRDERFKLVRTQTENCATNQLELAHGFYKINEAAPLPKLDRARDNLLSAPTLPPQGLNPIQRKHFNKLSAELDALLRSEAECPGDGNLDKQVDKEDLQHWQAFADTCAENPNRCSIVYDLNLDAVTNAADRQIIEENFGRRCPGFRPQ
jgi:arylsulfatase A-like enzyme